MSDLVVTSPEESGKGWSSFIQGPLKVTKPEMAAAPAMSFFGHSNGWSPGTSESVWVLRCPGHFLWGSAVSGVGPRAPSQYLGTFCCTAQKTPPPQSAASGLSEILASEVGNRDSRASLSGSYC
ncbi:hypothetical protein U0070_023644 [Myodes glareolus]|uniref:Uncharacterized protein n=1 Tax=Myodes glareolus TaxID=447135 RepID=A0AAW0IPS9_MYOGA